MKTVRRPPYPKWNPGYFPCSSLTPPSAFLTPSIGVLRWIRAYTTLGWREPCYLLGDRHTQDIDDLYTDELWEKYGVGKDIRCANCMMHCGFESASLFEALGKPADMLTLVKEGAVQNSGVGA